MYMQDQAEPEFHPETGYLCLCFTAVLANKYLDRNPYTIYQQKDQEKYKIHAFQ